MVFKRGTVVSMKINISDIPDHNLRLIGESDPSYNRRISEMLNGREDNMVETLKPWGVFLVNNSAKSIVAYAVKWELIRPDGTKTAQVSSNANPRALMDGGEPGTEEVSRTMGAAIKPGSYRFITCQFSMSVEGNCGISAIAVGAVDEAGAKELEQAARENNVNVMLKHVALEMEGYASITISIDGAFFEDGTFVGANTTQYYETMVAQIEAKRDLLKEILTAYHQNRLPEVYGQLDLLAQTSPSFGDTPDDAYIKSKTWQARDIIRLRKIYGDEKTARIALLPMHRKWIELRKL